MKRLVAALLLAASPALAQENGWQEIQNGWGEIQTALGSYATMPAPSGCVATSVPIFLGSPVALGCDSRLTYNATTDTLNVASGLVSASNLTATALATPGAITVTPTLTRFTTITVVAGASLADGDYFTLNDGTTTKVFEFDSGGGVTAGRVAITFVGTENAQAIRDLVVIAVNGAGLNVMAVAATADTLTVTISTPGVAGGANSENVANAGFLVPVWGEPTHATTYGYKVEACLADGTCAPSAEVQTTTGHATLSGANYNSVTWGVVTGTSYYKLTRVTGTPAGGDAPPRLLYAGTLLNFSDTNATSTSEAVATVNETGVLRGDGLRLGASATAGHVLTADAAGYYTPQAGGGISGLTTNTIPKATSATAIGNSSLSDSGTAVTSTVPVLFAAGTTLIPGVAFAAYPTTGFVGESASSVAITFSAVRGLAFSPSGIRLPANTAQITARSSADGVLTWPAAATLQLGEANSATPVAQKFRVQGGTGTNIAGQRHDRHGSLATGTADSGAIVDQTGYTAGATTTQHVYSDRSGLFARWTALTGGSATGFATLTYAASTSIGAEFFVTVRAGDASNRQGMSYRVAVNSVRDAAGNTQSVVAVIGTPPVAAGSGTLTCAFDVAEGAGAATLRANCASSLTETFLDANFQVIANGPGLTVAAL